MAENRAREFAGYLGRMVREYDIHRVKEENLQLISNYLDDGVERNPDEWIWQFTAMDVYLRLAFRDVTYISKFNHHLDNIDNLMEGSGITNKYDMQLERLFWIYFKSPSDIQ